MTDPAASAAAAAEPHVDPMASTPEVFRSDAERASPDAPYATIGDKTFKDAEELGACMAQQTGDTSHPGYKPAAGADATTQKEGEPKEGSQGAKGEEAEGNAQPEARTTPPTDDEIRANLKKAGGFYADPRYEPAALEFEKTGDLTPETVKKTAEAFGVPEDMVRSFVDLQKSQRALAAQSASTQANAKVQETVADLHEAAGGEEAYKAFHEWGKENLGEEEKAAYNKALDNDPATAKVLLGAFMARFKASGEGPGPRDITRQTAPKGPSPETSQAGYASRAEQLADVNDPRYKNDPAFRLKVQQKTFATKAF